MNANALPVVVGDDADRVVLIAYTNHRGEVSLRRIIPQVFGFGANDYHTEPQFLLDAYDLEKRETRTFAMKDIHFWKDDGRKSRVQTLKSV